MKALLFIRGMKEPVALEEKEALAAQKLIGDSSKPNDTAFSIEDVWTGKKADMKYVVFPKVERNENPKKEIKPMTKEQAEAFEKEIAQDKAKSVEVYGNDKEGKPMDFRWREFFWERRGAIRVEITKLPDGRAHSTWFSKDPELFTQLSDEIESYWEFTRIRDFAEGKKLEQYDEMALQMEGLKENLIVKHDPSIGE